MFGTVAEVENYDKLTGGVYTDPDVYGDSHVLYGELESDPFIDEAILPDSVTQTHPQIADLEVWIDGEMVERINRIGEVVVEKDYDNIAQGWAFKLPILPTGSLYGSPEGCVGPSIGKKSVDIFGLYFDPDTNTEYRKPLITDGIVDTMPREAGEDGIFEEVAGLDRMGRFDERKVTRIFPPGHGLQVGRVCAKVFEDLEFPDFSFEDGKTMMKELQLVDALPMEPLKDILESDSNRRLFCDGSGMAINPRVGRVRSDESIKFNLFEKNFVRASVVRLEPQQNVITLVIANGTQQNVEDPAPCVMRVENETHYNYQDDYEVQEAPYRQNSDGSYTTLTPSPPTVGPVLIEKIEIFRRFLCEELVEERVKTYRLFRREKTRHKWVFNAISGENEWGALSAYTDDNTDNTGGAGYGAGPAYIDRRETLQLVEISHKFNYFLHADFIFSGGFYDWSLAVLTNNMTLAQAIGMEAGTFTKTPFYGQAQGTVTFYSRKGHTRGNIKTRLNVNENWTDVEPVLNKEVWGDGSGYSPYAGAYEGFLLEPENDGPGNVDALIPFNINAVGFEGNSIQQLEVEDTVQVSWRAKRGNLFYFGDNDSRSEAVEAFRTVDVFRKTYDATGKTHSETTVHTDTITGITKTQFDAGLSGSLPAIERLDFVDPEPDLYQAGELSAPDEDTGEMILGLDKKAKRGDTTQITVTVPFDFFLTCHLPREVVTDFQWAENEDELRAMAEALAQESAAMPFFGTLVANFMIEPTQAIKVTYRPLELEDANVRVKRVRHVRSVDAPLLTEIEGRYYAF